jgi:biopolymer transport protein ExbB/TolQ
MSTVPTRKSASLNPPVASRGIHALRSPWLWGPLFTVTFYMTVPRLPIDRELVTRLFAGHWSLHAEIGLFLFGLATLIGRMIGLIHERQSLKMIVIDAASLDGIESPADRARALHLATTNVPAGIRSTKLMLRIREVCDYVARRGSGAGVEDHLRYLADLAVENLASSFALLRTLIWTVPAVGLLGTILAATTALQSIESGDQEGSLSAVVAGLGGACDPVTLGLGLSLILVYGKLLLERSETRVLALVEQFGIDELAPCLCSDAAADAAAPLTAAETEAAAKLVDKTESLINWQTELWQKALEGLRNRWLETVQQQQTQFTKALEQGMAASLTSHSQQLDEARGDFLKAFRAVGLELSRVTAGLQQMGEEHQSQFHKQVGEVWQAMQAHMASSQGEHEEHLARSVGLLEKAVHGWQDNLARATAAMTAQLHELQRHGEVLQNVAGQEEELIRLQSTLTHNLQSVRAMEKFEESIHSLNAAVHLLTMRTKAHAA